MTYSYGFSLESLFIFYTKLFLFELVLFKYILGWFLYTLSWDVKIQMLIIFVSSVNNELLKIMDHLNYINDRDEPLIISKWECRLE